MKTTRNLRSMSVSRITIVFIDSKITVHVTVNLGYTNTGVNWSHVSILHIDWNVSVIFRQTANYYRFAVTFWSVSRYPPGNQPPWFTIFRYDISMKNRFPLFLFKNYEMVMNAMWHFENDIGSSGCQRLRVNFRLSRPLRTMYFSRIKSSLCPSSRCKLYSHQISSR